MDKYVMGIEKRPAEVRPERYTVRCNDRLIGVTEDAGLAVMLSLAPETLAALTGLVAAQDDIDDGMVADCLLRDVMLSRAREIIAQVERSVR